MKQKTHEFIIKVRFNKPISKSHALHEVKDNVHGDFYPAVNWADGAPTYAKISCIKNKPKNPLIAPSQDAIKELRWVRDYCLQVRRAVMQRMLGEENPKTIPMLDIDCIDDLMLSANILERAIKESRQC